MRSNQGRRIHLVVACAAALLCLLLPTGAQATAQETKLKLVAYHVFATKGEKPSIPKEIRAYRKNLGIRGHNVFTVVKTERVTLEGDHPHTCTLPGGLGTAKLERAGQGRVKASVKKGKKVLGVVAGPLPLILFSETIKTKDGKQYILILVPDKKRR